MGAEHFVLGRLDGRTQEVAGAEGEVVERLIGAVDHVGPDVAGFAVGLTESGEGRLCVEGGAAEGFGGLAVIVAAEHAVDGRCGGGEGIGVVVAAEQTLHFFGRLRTEVPGGETYLGGRFVADVANVRKQVANVKVLELQFLGREVFFAGEGLCEHVVVDIGGVLRGRVGRGVEIVAQGQAGGVVHRHGLDAGQETLEGHAAGTGKFGLEGGVAERGEFVGVAEHPEGRSALLIVGHDFVAREARLFAGLIKVDAGNVEAHVVGVAESLAECLAIERALGLVAVVVLDPGIEVGDDVLQVADAVLTGLDGIVAEGLFDGRGVAHGLFLLETVAIEGIAGVRLDEIAQFLVFGDVVTLEFGEGAVGPVDGVVVVDAECGGIEIGDGIAGLRHVVVAGIVHDGRRGAVDIGEGFRAK